MPTNTSPKCANSRPAATSKSAAAVESNVKSVVRHLFDSSIGQTFVGFESVDGG
jgi:hypothetical protein